MRRRPLEGLGSPPDPMNLAVPHCIGSEDSGGFHLGHSAQSEGAGQAWRELGRCSGAASTCLKGLSSIPGFGSDGSLTPPSRTPGASLRGLLAFSNDDLKPRPRFCQNNSDLPDSPLEGHSRREITRPCFPGEDAGTCTGFPEWPQPQTWLSWCHGLPSRSSSLDPPVVPRTRHQVHRSRLGFCLGDMHRSLVVGTGGAMSSPRVPSCRSGRRRPLSRPPEMADAG